jgi:hypothetical protein
MEGSGMKYLLNISTHGSDLDIIGDDWSAVHSLLADEGFDGLELYPVPEYPEEKVPKDLITGIHLRFFVILDQIWKGDRRGLLKIFGNEEAVRHFYGGDDRSEIIDTYRRQLAMAERFSCEYVVFHPVHAELEYIYTWEFPWTWQYTVDLAADVINEVMAGSDFSGKLLFENLWWPGNFRLDSPAEIERLLGRVNYGNCGIVFDTGHCMNKNQSITTELEGIDYIVKTINDLGSLASEIQAVHLTKSMSAAYVKQSRKIPDPYEGADGFWDRLAVAWEHVRNIDTHDPFERAEIAGLFDYIDPDHVVFEFSFANEAEWRRKVETQNRAITGLPPGTRP